MIIPAVCLVVCLVITGIAAVTDARTGHIPNWLTLPPLLIAPLAWFAHGGIWRTDRGSLVGSLLSMLLCAAVPYMLHRNRAIGGGDVKLFACIGALALAGTGIEAQFYAFCAGSLFALARLAWDGLLLRTLSNTFFIALNPILPKRYKRTIARELMTELRFGVPIFVGTVVAALANGRAYGLL